MRILVTKQGNVIIQEIDDTMPIITQNINTMSKLRGYSTSYNPRRPNLANRYSTSNQFTKTNNLYIQNLNRTYHNGNDRSKISSIPKTNFKKKLQNLEDLEITKEEIQAAKQIKINEHKITFPKQFAEKYENDILNNNIISTSNNILPSLNSNKIDFPEGSNSSLIKKEKYLSFGEIIPNTSLTQMKKKIINDRRIRDRATFITENDFRSPYEPETEIQKFNNILVDAKLNSNKSSLIKYLNEKQINPLTIKVLSYQDGDKISKLNKICQTIIQNQEKEKLFNDIVKNKVKQHINNTKKEFQTTINDMGNEINTIEEKLKKYDKKIDNKEKYREYFNEMVMHYWLKKDLERFNKKSTPKPNYMKTFFDGEDSENSKK